MKKATLSIIVIGIMFCANMKLVNASQMEKGNPVADFHDSTILSNGKETPINEYDTLLFLNGTIITDYEIIIRDDRALVPIRLISEGLGASVVWNESEGTVTITKSQKEIVLEIDSKVASVEGLEINLDYPAIIL